MLSKPLLTTHEVAELLKIKEAKVRRWIRDGELPAILFHREWRVPVTQLERYVEARATSGRTQQANGGCQSKLVSQAEGQSSSPTDAAKSEGIGHKYRNDPPGPN